MEIALDINFFIFHLQQQHADKSIFSEIQGKHFVEKTIQRQGFNAHSCCSRRRNWKREAQLIHTILEYKSIYITFRSQEFYKPRICPVLANRVRRYMHIQHKIIASSYYHPR